jgi:hypothetical protein
VFKYLMTLVFVAMPLVSIVSAKQHEFESSVSWLKPSSESHLWSYQKACERAINEIEKRHGVDWKLTSIVFIDRGRSTNTTRRWDGKRTWSCTHSVIARYEIVRRGHGGNDAFPLEVKCIIKDDVASSKDKSLIEKELKRNASQKND